MAEVIITRLIKCKCKGSDPRILLELQWLGLEMISLRACACVMCLAQEGRVGVLASGSPDANTTGSSWWAPFSRVFPHFHHCRHFFFVLTQVIRVHGLSKAGRDGLKWPYS